VLSLAASLNSASLSNRTLPLAPQYNLCRASLNFTVQSVGRRWMGCLRCGGDTIWVCAIASLPAFTRLATCFGDRHDALSGAARARHYSTELGWQPR
jgi:hypothetical protein